MLAVVVATPLGFALALSWLAPPEVPLAPLREDFLRFPPSRLTLTPRVLGAAPHDRPRITNVSIVDLDEDGLPDVLACDAQAQRVFWERQAPRGQWTETPVSDEIAGPCHTALADLDGDGDRDIVVAGLGRVWPTNDLVGKVIWLENAGAYKFKTHVLVNHLRRVTDVQPGDLDGDGDIDLVVAEFGFDHGRVFWLENLGGRRFRDHELWAAPGPIHVPVADYDGDGDLDVVALVSQEDEEVWAFENLGKGKFQPRLLFATVNADLGAAGLFLTDLDKDGKPDLLLVAGDNLEVQYPAAQAWHGCIWLKNEGSWKFTSKRLGYLGGTYAAAVGDLDGDGDNDVVLASMFNDWRRTGAASVVWLEHDGQGGFTPWQIAERPTHVATVACGDLDGDGKADIVAGGFHIQEPFDRIGRITLWQNGASPGQAAAPARDPGRKGWPLALRKAGGIP
jgi:VCBS repeat protein